MKQLTGEQEKVWDRLTEIYPVGHPKHVFNNFEEVMDFYDGVLQPTIVELDTANNVIAIRVVKR